MSVYIKGMEIPRSCEECYIREKSTCPLLKVNVTSWGKPLNCPLIEVPPHGRLIDADFFVERMEGLKKQAMADGFDSGAFWYEAFQQHIRLSPTIIPADADKEEQT